MEREIEKWIRRHRLLKSLGSTPAFENKKKFVLEAYEFALDNRTIPVEPYVCESFQAEITQIPNLKTIVLDNHFMDVAWYVAAAFYSMSDDTMHKLYNLLIANALLINNNPALAYQFSKQFRDLSMPLAPKYSNYVNFFSKVLLSTRHQLIFVAGHEIAHFYCEDKKNIIVDSLRNAMEISITTHNYHANLINSIDLSPIEKYLDEIDTSILSEAMDSEYDERHVKLYQDVIDIIKTHGHLVYEPTDSSFAPRQLLFFACDNYIRKRKSTILDVKEMVTEGACDMLSLLELSNTRIEGKSQLESHKFLMESYVLALLTTDLIELSKKICKWNLSDVESQVDEIYIRREREANIIPLFVTTILADDVDDTEYIEDVMKCYKDACDRADRLYAGYCEAACRIDYTQLKDDNPQMGTPRWKQFYDSIVKNLESPIDRGYNDIINDTL